MLEMLVALAVASIMILFVSQIFDSVSGAVSSGTALSKVVEHARTATDQFRQDGQLLVGADNGGFLIIINKEYNNYFTESGQKTDNDNTPPVVRSDQLAFVRTRGSLEPIAPSGSNSYAAGRPKAPYVRIWYGHALRTNMQGNGASGLGQSGPNRWATDWVLGRQALFLTPTNPSNSQPGSNMYALRAEWNAAVLGNPGGAGQLHKGATDIAAQRLSRSQQAADGAGGVTVESVEEAIDRYWNLHTAQDPRAQQILNFAFPTRRLWVNTRPLAPWQPWRIGQQHALFTPNVSEFKVQFAGDYYSAPLDPTQAPPDNLNPDGKIDTIDRQNGGNPIAWYDMNFRPGNWTANTDETSSNKPLRVLGANHNFGAVTQAFVWTHRSENWPMLIRVRYRMHGGGAQLAGADGRLGKVYEQVLRVR